LKNFTTRTITGLTYVLIISACIILHPFAFASIFAVITVIALTEFYNIAHLDNAQSWKYPGILAGLILFISNFLYASGYIQSKHIIGLTLMVFLLFFISLASRKGNILSDAGITFLGLIYIPLPMSMLAYLCYPGKDSSEYKFGLLLGYLVLIWLFDTGAYIVGSLIGKHKLMEKISPGKTWEGLIGGLIISIGIAIILSMLTHIITRTDWLIISIITAISGTLGDLVESGIKRNALIKDSGKILPGHGGILDRIDSILLSIPFVTLYLLIRNYY
jgi:phosphatidate cytidylyltransferase